MYLERFTRIPRNRFYICNLINCRPPKNRDPHVSEIDTCSVHLMVRLSEVEPSIVGCIGRLSAQWFLGRALKMEKAHGIAYECDGRIVVPLYHPAYGLHSPRRMKEIIEDFVAFGEIIRGERGVGVVGSLGIEPHYKFKEGLS
jgi:DNA polymerase